jgi:hypothetical protein
MSIATANPNRIWPNWWRFAGVDGVIFIVLFIIGGPILQGDFPTRSDSIESIREYWVEDGDMYLVGDYITSVAFIIFFLPYVVGLRWLLGTAEGSPPIWSWMAFAGAIVTIVGGYASAMLWGGLALGLEDNPELDDATIQLVMDIGAFTFSVFTLGIALFVGSAGFVIIRTGVLWRWLGAVALLAAILLIIGAAWPIEGDEEGAVAVFGFIGLPITILFILISSIAMILRKEPPAPVEVAG